MKYDERIRRSTVEIFALERKDGTDQFYKTMSFMPNREHDLIALICFKEMGCIKAAWKLGIGINQASVHVRHAFDTLGDALARMRRGKRALQKQVEKPARRQQSRRCQPETVRRTMRI